MKFYTFWIALICIIMFILQISFPSVTDNLLLNNQSFIQPWRFVTSIFLHASLEHLILNLFALILFGLILEKLIGSNRFLLVFFISGILANLVSVNFYNASLGASGAIFGIIGCLTIIRPTMAVFAFGIPMPLFIASLVWIIINAVQTFVPSDIGTIAHLSGRLFGAIFGFFLRKKQSKTAKQKIEIPEHFMRDWEDRHLR